MMHHTYIRAAAILCVSAGVCLAFSACSGKAVVKRKEGAPTQYQPASAISGEAELAAASALPEATPEQSDAAGAAASSTAAESTAASSEAASSEETQATPAPTPTPTPAPSTVSVAYSVSGNGWIEGTNPADVMPGSTASQVFVHPDAGWHLDHWEIGGITTSTQEAISVTVPADFTGPVFSAVAILVSDG